MDLAGSYVITEKDCEWNLELIQVVYQVAAVPGVLTELFQFAIEPELPVKMRKILRYDSNELFWPQDKVQDSDPVGLNCHDLTNVYCRGLGRVGSCWW